MENCLALAIDTILYCFTKQLSGRGSGVEWNWLASLGQNIKRAALQVKDF